MTEADLQRLLADRAVMRVRPDPETARQEIATARRHIAAAREIADLDPTLAFTGLYDAMRKAIQAHMRASGYRVTKGPGAHRKTGAYALAALDRFASFATRASTKPCLSNRAKSSKRSGMRQPSSTLSRGC